MSKLSLDFATGTFHPREGIIGSGALAALNSAISPVKADGANTASLVITGTYVGTIAVEGSIDGTIWDVIPVKPINAGGIYALTLASAAVGRWAGPVGQFVWIRARMTAFTSGFANVTLVAETGLSDVVVVPKAAGYAATVTAATGVAATLTLPAAGVGLYHYITHIRLQRHTSALLTAGSAPVVVTTANMPGSMAYSFQADASPQGTMYEQVIEPTNPIRSVTANTATTFVMPATTGVIWRASAHYYIAP